jgi:hypothetical protein
MVIAFGMIHFLHEPDPIRRDDICFTVLEAGVGVSLHVQMGLNITERESIFRILGQSLDRLDPDRVPFLLTDSPLSFDLNDLLPPREGEDDLRRNAWRFQRFIERLSGIPELRGVDLYVSDGYEEDYEEFAVPAVDLASMLQQLLYVDGGGVPAIKLAVVFLSLRDSNKGTQ